MWSATGSDGEATIAKLTRKSRMVALDPVFRLEIEEFTVQRLESGLQIILLATLHQGPR